MPIPLKYRTILKAVAEQIDQHSEYCIKRWVYVQYDSMVGTGNTSTNAPSDAAIVIAKPTNKGTGTYN